MKWLKAISISLFLLLLILMPVSSAKGADSLKSGFRLPSSAPTPHHRVIAAEVQRMNRGVVFVKTQEGTLRNFSIEEAKKEGISSLQKGDRLLLEIDEGNLIIDMQKQEAAAKAARSPESGTIGHPQTIKGALDSFDPLDRKVSIRLGSGETQSFEVKVPVLTKLNGVTQGAHITLIVDEQGRVKDAHKS